MGAFYHMFCKSKTAAENLGKMSHNFTVNALGEITGYTGSGGALVILSSIFGVPVIGIIRGSRWNVINAIPGGLRGVFQGKGLTSVIIPNSVTSIGVGAFWENQLTSITIGANVSSYFYSVLAGNFYPDTYFGFGGFDSNFYSAYEGTGKRAGTYTREARNSEGTYRWTYRP
jgi:hypothetical protein